MLRTGLGRCPGLLQTQFSQVQRHSDKKKPNSKQEKCHQFSVALWCHAHLECLGSHIAQAVPSPSSVDKQEPAERDKREVHVAEEHRRLGLLSIMVLTE